MEFASSLLIQWEGGVSRLGCYWAEWDSVAARLERSAAGCCVCQRPVSCSPALETQWQPSDALPRPLFLAEPHRPRPLLTHCCLSPPAPYVETPQLSAVTQANETEPGRMTRLQAVAFPAEKDVQEWEREQEEAKRRNHRRIGTVGARNAAGKASWM